MVSAGTFRADLYYRLNVFPIHLPPLRQRRDDIIPLAQHLVGLAASSLGRSTPQLTEEAAAALLAYSFPGNVRELSNLMERALVRCRGESLDVQQLGIAKRSQLMSDSYAGAKSAAVDSEAALSMGSFPQALPLNLDELERLAIAEALRRVNGNRTHAARLLGIGLRTLRNKLHALKGADSAQANVAGRQFSSPSDGFLTAFSTEFQNSVAACASQEESA
jgi:two-component system response regulator FlrC